MPVGTSKKSVEGFVGLTKLVAVLALAFTLVARPTPLHAQDSRTRADLATYEQYGQGTPLPIDGIWRLRELGKQVIIENGIVIAMEEWTHFFAWVVDPGMVTSSKLHQTGRQKFVAYDELLKRDMEWTVRADGTIFASGGTGLLAPKFSLEPIELSYPGVFEAMVRGEEVVLTPEGFGVMPRPEALEIELDFTAPVTSGDGMCLDLDTNDLGQQGGKLQVWECLGGNNQRFTYLEDDGLILSASGMCLEAVGTDNGAPVRAFGCDGNEAQVWTIKPLPGKQRQAFVNAGTGRCLDAHRPESKRNGGRIQIWDCAGGNNQSWSM
ncbi:RICIN domain-containing protein [Sphingorhabdus sp. 109]|uniref:RICIN domain-containing protein n=1 Tax=Sphingorhabdus sp. 109 TaxID=2653173 RepID=UPI0013571752|nr:RICIN domain-containing protein [Sphingorhabdus sp. 109]